MGERGIQGMPFEFVKEVDCYDFDKNSWKTLNFVSEQEKLMIINPGSLQISAKVIIIFGGVVANESEANYQDVIKDGQFNLSITQQSWLFDVTTGQMKKGPDMRKGSYFMNGGYNFTYQNSIYAFGFGMNQY